MLVYDPGILTDLIDSFLEVFQAWLVEGVQNDELGAFGQPCRESDEAEALLVQRLYSSETVSVALNSRHRTATTVPDSYVAYQESRRPLATHQLQSSKHSHPIPQPRSFAILQEVQGAVQVTGVQ